MLARFGAAPVALIASTGLPPSFTSASRSPPMLFAFGSITVSTADPAIAASTTLPPALRQVTAASAASRVPAAEATRAPCACSNPPNRLPAIRSLCVSAIARSSTLRLLRKRTLLCEILNLPHPEQAARWAARQRTQPTAGSLSMTNIYERLGVTPIINACGPNTRLSGGIMAPEVAQAMVEASQHCVDMVELQARASALIAEATGAEAG